MEFAAPRSGETADDGVTRRHLDQITPLLARRDLFSGVASFALVRYEQGGGVVDSVLAYVNGAGDERVLVAFNNSDRPVDGWVGGETCDGWSAWSRTFGEPAGSLELADPSGSRRAVTSGERLGEGLALPLGPWECAVLVASAG